MSSEQESDWSFCVRCLDGVSRSFSRPIAMLDPPIRESVTCAYLLCRIVDTIEDDFKLSTDGRSLLYKAFLDFLASKISEEMWSKQVIQLAGSEIEIELARGMGRVLHVLGQVPEEMQRVCHQWIIEMCRGMEIYSHRPRGKDGIRAINDLNDLYRYCYFVAGTVGHLLTELFILGNPQILNPDIQQVMQRYSESFGIGLQLVNILKDIAKDRQNGYSFIPRNLRQGLKFESLFDPAQRKKAHRMMAPIFKKAYQNLDEAMEYVLAIPPNLKSIRLFLLIPLWMAVPTLKQIEGNDAIFDVNAKVAISRAEVEGLINSCLTNCQDDKALQQIYLTMRAAKR